MLYAYDAAGRVSDETVSREAGGTTNLYKTAYAYSHLTYGRQLIRSEQTYSGGWVDTDRVTYQWDSREYQDNEEREDWNSGAMPPAWETRYDVAQEYDKNGNRTRMHRNTVSGYETDYGNNEDLSYTFNNVNQMSAIADADDANYSCSVTCDANNNITQIEEVENVLGSTATITTDFTYDWGNRLTEHQTQQYNQTQGDTWLTIRGHTIDAVGRTAKSGYEARWAASIPSPPDELEHVYDRAKMLQNYDGTSSYGERWHWAGAANQHSAPLASPNADTASQKGYNISNDKTPQRRTFTNPTSEGDQRHLYGQGKPQAKNSSGAGANWYIGEAAEASGISAVKVYSRTMFDGTVTATDMDRATDAREKGRIGIFGTGNAYAGSSGRVTSERIGRDLNPLGRGDGNAFVGGAQNYGKIAPRLPGNTSPGGWGNSVNNGCTDGGCGLPPNGDYELYSNDVLVPTVSTGHEDHTPYDPDKPLSPGNCDCYEIWCVHNAGTREKTIGCSQTSPTTGKQEHSTCKCTIQIFHFYNFQNKSRISTGDMRNHCNPGDFARTKNCCVSGGYKSPTTITLIYEYAISCGRDITQFPPEPCEPWCEIMVGLHLQAKNSPSQPGVSSYSQCAYCHQRPPTSGCPGCYPGNNEPSPIAPPEGPQPQVAVSGFTLLSD